MNTPAPKSILGWIIRVLSIGAITAVAVPLFQSFFDAQATLPALLREYLFSVIYSNLIGIPICLVLPPVWIRTSQLAFAAKSIIRAAVVLAANFIGCLIAGLILRAIIGPAYHYWVHFRVSLGLSLVVSAIATAFLSMYEVQQSRLKVTAMQLKTKELERERALKLATEARLSSLEARIHPHFLFNTLNSVSSLIHEDPQRAERIVTQLADLLRFSLDAAPGGLVPLDRELQIVENYLEIEKARFGDRLKYTVEIPVPLCQVLVPPLALQTLVENSVKHAVGPRGRGASLVIRASHPPGLLRLEVQDDGPGFTSMDLPAGHGLNNLEERLSALFGAHARLDIHSGESQTLVAIEIPHRLLSLEKIGAREETAVPS